MARSSTQTGILLALVCLLILGVMPVISNGRPAGFGALGFAVYLSLWQWLFATPLYLREATRSRRTARPQPHTGRARAVMLFTGILFGIATWLYVLGAERAGAVSAAIAIQAYPLFAILWETLFLKRGKTRAELALTGLLVVALYFLGTSGTWRIDGFSPWFFVALGVPFLWSIAHVIIREELSRSPITPAEITFARVAISSVFLLLVGALVAPAELIQPLTRPDFQLFALVMGLVYYLELLIWFHAVRFIDVSLASSITTPWPAVTMALAALLLGDAIAAYQVATFLIVVFCIYGLTLLSLRKERAAT